MRWLSAWKHRRTDPACQFYHGRTPRRSYGKSCRSCFPLDISYPDHDYLVMTWILGPTK